MSIDKHLLSQAISKYKARTSKMIFFITSNIFMSLIEQPSNFIQQTISLSFYS